jgi:DNA-binding SARP family transcriptional activator
VAAPDAGSPHAPAAQLTLLGGFELRLHGAAVELPHSAERLISFLALHRRELMRVFVAGSLWIDASESQANSSLRSVLWRLGARVPVVRATSTHVSLASWIEVDVARTTALVRRMQDDDAPPHPADLLAVSDAGELLPDWYDEWLIVERERIRQRRLHSLETACVRLTAAGRHGEAIEAGLAAVAVEPLRESGHAVVIQAHLAEGNLVEASRQYEQLRDLLREHLGTQPSRRVRMLLRDGQVTLA